MFEEKEYLIFKRGLGIDIMRMDDEFMRHPSMVQAVAERASEATQLRDAAKHDLDVAKARAANRLRGADADGKTPSETRVNSLLLLDGTVIEFANALSEAEHDNDLWKAMVDAMRQKGSSLKHLGELIVAGYLAPHQVRRQEMANQASPPRKRVPSG